MNLEELYRPKITKKVYGAIEDWASNLYGQSMMVEYLSRQGWTPFGMGGKYSSVFENKKYNYVLKVNKIEDIGYELYVNTIKGKRNIHFPKISDRKLHISHRGEKYYAYLIEKLEHIEEGKAKEYSSIFRDFVRGTKNGIPIEKIFSPIYYYPNGIPDVLKNDPTMVAALKLLVTVNVAHNTSANAGHNSKTYSNTINFDLHEQNIMQRTDGTIVITDPYY